MPKTTGLMIAKESSQMSTQALIAIDVLPGNAPEELRQDKAHTGDEGDGGHCEEVGVRDQAAHKS